MENPVEQGNALPVAGMSDKQSSWLVRVSVFNPYLVIVLCLFIVVIGYVCLTRVPVDILPSYKTPAVQVLTLYPGMPTEFMDRDPETYCFSPLESEAERSVKRREKRRSRLTPSQAARRCKRDRSRPPKHHYTKDSYRRAIARACELAFGMPDELRNIRTALMAIPESRRAAEKRRLLREAAAWREKHCWSPNQLRHSRATIIRERYGIEAAQVVLGHSDPRVTEIYSERDFAMAARVMQEIG